MITDNSWIIQEYNVELALKTLSGADRPHYRCSSSTPFSLSPGIERTRFQPELERAAREQRLFYYIDRAALSGEIMPQTAKLAWKAWTQVNGAFSRTLSVPDASYGPDGQFLFIWDRDEHHLELEIEQGGGAYFFYRNRISGAVWGSDHKLDGSLEPGIMEKLRIFV